MRIDQIFEKSLRNKPLYRSRRAVWGGLRRFENRDYTLKRGLRGIGKPSGDL